MTAPNEALPTTLDNQGQPNLDATMQIEGGDIDEIVGISRLKDGIVDYTENDQGKEFAPVIPFSYARIDHPYIAGEVIPATSFIKGTWHTPRAVSRQGEVISPATRPGDDGYDYEPRELEGKSLAVKASIGGLIRRIRGKETGHHHRETPLDTVDAASYQRLFDENNPDEKITESRLMLLDTLIKQRTATAKSDWKAQHGPLSSEQSKDISTDTMKQVIQEYIRAAGGDADNEEVVKHIDMARRMVAERLSIVDKYEAEAAERKHQAEERLKALKISRERRGQRQDQDEESGRTNNRGDAPSRKDHERHAAPKSDDREKDISFEPHEATYFNRDELLKLDAAISETIRDEVHAIKDSRGVAKLPRDEFNAVAAQVRERLMYEYLGNDASDELYAKVDSARRIAAGNKKPRTNT